MVTALPEPETLPVEPETDELPDATSLEDRSPEWMQFPRVVAGFTAVAGLVYLFLSYLPLWHTDIWGHLAYGRMIWQSGAIPATEPLMPLSSGVPFVDTAWLSQLIGFGSYSVLGVEALRGLFAASITVCFALLLHRCYRRTGSVLWTIGALAMFMWVEWEQLKIVRPQLAGMICFVGLFVMLTSRRWRRANWIVVPLMFALWANLHGSFVVGLLLLGTFCVGRAIDVLRKTGRLSAAFRDIQVRRYFLLTELAAVAVLLNPYGLGIYAEVIAVSANLNLSDLVEWEPLSIRMKQGRAAAAAVVALLFVYRMSPRRISATEILLLLGLGAAALWTSRMIVWWGPVAVYYLALHGSAIRHRFSRKRIASEPSPRNAKWGIVTVGVAWICVAYTPLGSTVLHGKQADPVKSVSRLTPVGAAEYLKKHPPQGQVFNTYEWGDYLLWAGPPKMEIFLASHAHLVPREVWGHYQQIAYAAAGWDELLGRYSVNTIVIDPNNQKRLADRLRRHVDWEKVREDDRSIIFVRKEPIQ